MAQCVQFVLVDGNYSLQPSPADQTPANCQGYLLLTPEEFSSTQNPFFVPLSMSDGALISTAIALVWAIAFVFKTLRKSLDVSTNGDSP